MASGYRCPPASWVSAGAGPGPAACWRLTLEQCVPPGLRSLSPSPPHRLSNAGVLTETTAELALALTFAAARRVVEGDSFMRGGHYKGWLPTLFVGNLLQARCPPVPRRRHHHGLPTHAP